MAEIYCIYHRHSIRLKGYDYSLPGAYFITICTQDREYLFGEIVNGEMVLNDLGEMVNFTWFDLVNHVENIELGPFVIMPNHIHGVIQIVGAGSNGVGEGSNGVGAGANGVGAGANGVGEGSNGVGAGANGVGAGSEPAPTKTKTTAKQTPLSEIVRQFKTFSARRVNALRNIRGVPVWQRNYYEHIIRNEESYLKITQYILDNPAQWEVDSLGPGKMP